MSDITMRTGDDLICQGKALASQAIKCMNWLSGTRGKALHATHVAQVISPIPNHDMEVWESTSIGYTGIKGVQCNPFEEWLENYNGHVFLQRYDFERTIEFEAGFGQFTESLVGTPYESGIAGFKELFLAGAKLDRFVRMKHPDYNPASTANLHCTEGGIKVKKFVNMVSGKAIASRMPPSEWWPGGLLHEYLLVPALPLVQLK